MHALIIMIRLLPKNHFSCGHIIVEVISANIFVYLMLYEHKLEQIISMIRNVIYNEDITWNSNSNAYRFLFLNIECHQLG